MEKEKEITPEMLEPIVREILSKLIIEHEKKLKEVSLLERIIRVEEELKALRQIEMERFEAINTRFEAINTRFEAMDTRFDALMREMNIRFEAMERRFEALERRFNFLQWLIVGGFAFISILLSILKFF